MATELAQAYVQIIPSAKGIKGKLTQSLGGEAASAGESAGASLGSSMVGKLKGIIAAAGLGAVLKSAISEGANLEQSFGGLETIYGNAAGKAKQFAAEAQAAGISMNDYAEQAVSFGAALNQAFNGDTEKSVEAANTALLDMADNAAKMGTPIENLQTAYQGFAKQNYTMLDNLKLGYGGTKTEMQRLLKDAEKISGVKYNMDNLGDVYEAIHVIQGELGLTGVAADEAASTLSGSLGAMKAAFQNVLGTIATGGDVSSALKPLLTSVSNFLTNNLFPMVGRILKTLPDLIGEAFSFAIRSLNQLANGSSGLLDAGFEIISGIAEAVVTSAPYLIESLWGVITSLGESLVNFDWSGSLSTVVSNMRDGLELAAGEILGSDNLDFITPIINGIVENAPKVLESAGEIINNIADGLYSSLPTIYEKGGEILDKLVEGIQTLLPKLGTIAGTIIGKLATTIIQNAPQILQSGIELMGKLALGILKAIPTVLTTLFNLGKSMGEELFKIDWASVGSNVIEGIVSGLKSAGSQVWEYLKGVCEDVLTKAKDFFGIHSPSTVMRDQVGRWIPEGIAKGIVENARPITNAMHDLTNDTINAWGLNDASLSGSLALNSQLTASGEVNSIYYLLSRYLPSIASGENMNVVIQNDPYSQFKAVKETNDRLTRATGFNQLSLR